MATVNPLAPWRIVIKAMGEDRGPGEVLGTIYRPAAHLAGASINYNAPGELHFTLLVDDPNILLPVPKLTHYAVQFQEGGPQIAFNEPTGIWDLDEDGTLHWPVSGYTAEGDTGPYPILQTTVPYKAGDPEHGIPASGGDFWTFYEIQSGPYEGKLIAFSEDHSYGDITLTWDGPDGAWPTTFEGLIWDVDATETEAVFYGVDYLGLFQYVLDERFDPDEPDEPAPTGSFHVTTDLRSIAIDMLTYAVEKPYSPVGFIKLGETPIPMGVAREVEGLYSTFANVLDFVVGLIQSHRAGTGINTRICVKRDEDLDEYRVHIYNDPGERQSGLDLGYGDLVQGYRVMKFGPQWASTADVISRDRDGLKVEFRKESGYSNHPLYGDISMGAVVMETKDHYDLLRRARQQALDAAVLTRKLGVGLKLGSYKPLEEFDLCDTVAVDINHGAVDTMSWNETGLWWIAGTSWETYDDGHWMTNVALVPFYGVSGGCG